MINKKTNGRTTLAGAALLGSLGTLNLAQAAENPFEVRALETGYMQMVGTEPEGKCGEGKCGGKGDEGKCGSDQADKEQEGKCGEGKCGGKGDEGKCGSDQADKEQEGKCGEGKCGDNDVMKR